VKTIALKVGTGYTMVIAEDAWRKQSRRIRKMATENREIRDRLKRLTESYESTIASLGETLRRLNQAIEEKDGIISDQRARICDYRMELESRGEGSHAV
jgi:hypothetical protein